MKFPLFVERGIRWVFLKKDDPGRGDGSYFFSALDRAIKVQEVILRAVNERWKWYEAAKILGDFGAADAAGEEAIA